MNTQKAAMRKIATIQKEELSAQKVELGAIDDLENDWKAVTKGYSEVANLARKANQTLNEMLKEYKSIEDKGRKVASQLKELGVEDKDFNEVMRKVARDKGAILDTKKRTIGSY